MNYIQYMKKPALQILKLDDAANTAAYNEAVLYFESLGFRGKTASDLALEKVHSNVLFDAGNLPEVEVVAKAWGDGDDASRRENYQKARKAERESEEKALQHEMNQSIREATDKWGHAIGAGVEIASGFTPLWWVAPAVRTGLDLSEGNYKGAALNAGLAFAAPYAVGKGIQYISPYAKSAILASKLNRLIRNTKLPQSLLNVTELHPHSRVKVGDVEINNPNLAYRQVNESIAREFPITGRQIPTMAESGYGIERATKPTGIILGKAPFKNPMYAQGHLWYGIPQEKSTLSGLLVTNQPLLYSNMTANTVNTSNIITSKDGLVTRVFDPNSNLFSVGTRRIPSPGLLNSTNTSSYIYEPGYGYRKVVTQLPKTSLAFFERLPAKISEAERLGIPKGIKYYTQEENLAFRDQINNFAKKYGYEPIGDEVTDPEVLERYARSLIKRHNTFYRGVELNPKESNLSLEYMATHAPGGGAGELYITPYLSVAAMYGEPVEILRPYKLGADRTRWFDKGDFQIYTAGGRRDMHLWEDKKGIAAPWLRSETFEGKTSWVYKPHVETELTGRNLQFIPISVLYRHIHPNLLPVDRVGSLAIPNTPFYKSGGSIKIKKKNCGSFTRYCNGKVTEECIRKGKNSSNPTTRKRANFAWVARHKFKHEEGGKLNYLNYFN